MSLIWGLFQKRHLRNQSLRLNWNLHIKCHSNVPGANGLTLKHRETHGCVVCTVATDALVLKHQAISIHNAD